MKQKQIIALVLLVAAAGLGYWGYQESQALGNRLTRGLTGEMDTNVVVLYVAALACAIGGLVTLLKR